MKNENQIHPLILKRRSIFSFSDEPVSYEKLMVLFEAAGKAPSSFNAQPWGFIFATKENPGNYKKMADLLMEGNKTWALSAPVLILSLAQTVSAYNNRKNPYAFHDLGMATGNLLFQAAYMGLFIHPMGGYDKDRARKVLKISEDYEPAAMMALGYPGKTDKLPDELKKRQQEAGKRKPLDEIIREGAF